MYSSTSPRRARKKGKERAKARDGTGSLVVLEITCLGNSDLAMTLLKQGNFSLCLR
jgi:hypothetical protein